MADTGNQEIGPVWPGKISVRLLPLKAQHIDCFVFCGHLSEQTWIFVNRSTKD